MKIKSKDALKRASKVKILIMDVDGVLTDGRIVIDDKGIESKFFDVRDGHGIKMLGRAGIKTAIVTGRNSKVVKHRARELSIDYIYQGAIKKGETVENILKQTGLTGGDAAYVGDDLIDIPAMKLVGFAVAVADSVDEVLKTADIITEKPGGRGAVREVVEFILKSQGIWEEAIKRYSK
ncbi:MAG: HAD-IIIA family hydrolase [Deltaproteobacteria bacterium]|uniref:HAD-IIIA family hydrolase n=1 Tax=Candidatus Zymogenus saltonus TaxID=2844893 RepID=A0A9D8PME6_9DELT|nr:HAD-IIIA family hydrolase [Candidatus Zymogenus saltonus]